MAMDINPLVAELYLMCRTRLAQETVDRLSALAKIGDIAALCNLNGGDARYDCLECYACILDDYAVPLVVVDPVELYLNPWQIDLGCDIEWRGPAVDDIRRCGELVFSRDS